MITGAVDPDFCQTFRSGCKPVCGNVLRDGKEYLKRHADVYAGYPEYEGLRPFTPSVLMMFESYWRGEPTNGRIQFRKDNPEYNPFSKQFGNYLSGGNAFPLE